MGKHRRLVPGGRLWGFRETEGLSPCTPRPQLATLSSLTLFCQLQSNHCQAFLGIWVAVNSRKHDSILICQGLRPHPCPPPGTGSPLWLLYLLRNLHVEPLTLPNLCHPYPLPKFQEYRCHPPISLLFFFLFFNLIFLAVPFGKWDLSYPTRD